MTKNWKIAFIIVAVIAAVSTGFAIYYGRSGSVAYAQEMNAINAELKAQGEILESQLESALEDLRASQEYALIVDNNNEEIILLTISSNEILGEISEILGGININNLRVSVQRLGEFALHQFRINQRTLELLEN